MFHANLYIKTQSKVEEIYAYTCISKYPFPSIINIEPTEDMIYFTLDTLVWLFTEQQRGICD